ncbi:MULTISPECIES: hydroxymethylglutaryl-CoA lyase [unclassified Microbacterium]|uniref:hydroxymethylglutaryl-CoA lyase n=1 Tax=unclassified Microbacterium TaxID=2609290 RepID=UPI00097EBD34|nr:hydroxymethylglutaryl-CoA lyase [Microbacterium sp. JB110]RCS57231.1 hydroxymethylglutaryl-CoA lyase [Microbacterium sp. JB110]SJM59155.1 Hydroxymethylglutaryl-CoA lyase [Frigoribacterium sp. JB110]
MTRPRVEPEDGLPSRVTVYEVGPRDGLQAEPDIVPTDVKAELCRRLYATGVRDLELTSFVPPAWIPQLADAADVTAAVHVPEGARGVALVPNLRGLERARDAGIREVAVVVSATESFARANLNVSREGAVERAADVVEAASGTPVRGYVSMAFGDPWEGEVDIAAVAETAVRLHRAGCRTIALGDTIGVATPGLTARVITETIAAGVPVDALALHLHDTYGQSLANVHAALRLGVSEFDAAVGGLGRCPYAKGATGNLATEALVWMLDGMGIETGIDVGGMAATATWLSRIRGIRAPSTVATAMAAAASEEES